MHRFGDAEYFSQTPKLDLIQKQLDNDSTSQKLEALKQLIAMTSKGGDAASMFPYVVKNIMSSSEEVKKLVYMYIIHYAERKPDEALLSISHFQKDMTHKNQFIRASALRVLSSIRVPLIAQIVMIAIRKCAGDMSPYVRKAAAIAIPKLYNLNPEDYSTLIVIIEQLLGDNSTIVLGAAMFAYAEVCPERYDLLHRHYRKLCRLLVDCDEWGQVVIANCLLRYARTQFLNPFKEGYKKKQEFYEHKKNGDDSDEDSSDGEDPYVYDMDPDHKLLLKSTAPLLQSRNSSVVLAVASLYFHVAPVSDFGIVVRPLLRIARTFREAQYVILTTISSMATERPSVFRPHFKDFFVSATDATMVRELKLNILAKLAVESNATTILKEFRVYARQDNIQFMKSAVRAIGRVANNIPEVADSCMNDLLGMVNSKKEEVAAEAVIIMRYLLQKKAASHPRIVRRLARMLDTIHAPVARASIIWLVGEYQNLIPTLAPDAFRKLAKSFRDEANVAKLQIITLGVKLYLSDQQDVQTKARISEIFQFVLQMAKYDVEYDIRDRTRLTRVLLFSESDSEGAKTLRTKLKDVLLCEKAPPEFEGKPQDQTRFQLSSMSHIINHNVVGYVSLPNFPDSQPDIAMRDTDNRRYLYSESEESSSESEEATESETASEKDEDDTSEIQSSEAESESSATTTSSSSSAQSTPRASAVRKTEPSLPAAPPRQPDLDIADLLSSQISSFGAPSAAPQSSSSSTTTPSVRHQLLSSNQGKGLSAQFTESDNSLYPGMKMIHLWFHNNCSQEVTQVHVGREDLPHGADLIAFSPISAIAPGGVVEVAMHAKSSSTPSAPLKFEIWTSTDQFPVSLLLGQGSLSSLSFSSSGSL